VPLSIEDLWSDVTEASGKRMQLFIGGMEVLGAKQFGELIDLAHRKTEETNIPKSAITISESESFVR
jgi:hypothetical protein